MFRFCHDQKSSASVQNDLTNANPASQVTDNALLADSIEENSASLHAPAQLALRGEARPSQLASSNTFGGKSRVGAASAGLTYIGTGRSNRSAFSAISAIFLTSCAGSGRSIRGDQAVWPDHDHRVEGLDRDLKNISDRGSRAGCDRLIALSIQRCIKPIHANRRNAKRQGKPRAADTEMRIPVKFRDQSPPMRDTSCKVTPEVVKTSTMMSMIASAWPRAMPSARQDVNSPFIRTAAAQNGPEVSKARTTVSEANRTDLGHLWDVVAQ